MKTVKIFHNHRSRSLFSFISDSPINTHQQENLLISKMRLLYVFYFKTLHLLLS